jgi:hypothetical protein
MAAPRLSVVLPLGDDRGLAAESVRAWTRQTLPADLYEIVAVDDRRHARRAERVRQALRAHDQLVVVAGGGEIELYQGGAEAARGELLLFTESHAVPALEALEGLLRHLDRTGAEAATLRSAHLARRGLAALEERLGETARAERTPAEWWAGVSLRGFALRRSLFRELGGFRTDLERFAETALAIEMDRRGLRADEARDAVVRHGDCTRPAELEPALLALGRGRRAYVDAGPPELVRQYLGDFDPLSRAVLDAGLARELCAEAARSILERRGGAATVAANLAALRRFVPTALAGPTGASLALRASARISLLRCMVPLGDGDRRFARFRRAWHDVWSCGQIQHLERQALPPPARPPEPLRFSLAAPDTDFVGFHARETDAVGTFRWTEPAALWRLALVPDDYRARLHLSLPPQDSRLRLSLNGHALRPVAEGSPETLAFGVPRAMLRLGGEQHLVLLSLPFRPQLLGRGDARTLGIAVRSLDLVPRDRSGAGQ